MLGGHGEEGARLGGGVTSAWSQLPMRMELLGCALGAIGITSEGTGTALEQGQGCNGGKVSVLPCCRWISSGTGDSHQDGALCRWPPPCWK